MPKTKRYLPFPLFIVIFVILFSGVWYVIKSNIPRPQPISINELATAGSVSLTLTPATVELLPNVESTISLNVNSGTDRLAVVKFELSYDPTKLTVTTPTLGTWITKELAPLTLTSGKLTGEIGAMPDPDPTVTDGGPEIHRTGAGTLLTFKVKGVTPGSYSIVFTNANTTAWTATGTTANANNMLKTTSGTQITITDPALATDIVGTTHKVDKYDYVELVRQYGVLPAGTADFNHSGAVNGADYTIFMVDYGKTW